MSEVRSIRVLVVDDSAFARKVIREMLMSSPLINVVAVARDGLEALELVAAEAPDVVVCDLIMPKLDGVGFVRRQMAARPLPILILSSISEDAEKAVDALGAGAIEIIRKPTALANDELHSIRERLIGQVLALASVTRPESLTLPTSQHALKVGAAHPSPVDVVVLGISTGGPQALRYLIPLLPQTFPVPIAIVLHMPVGYTALFAEKLNELSQLEVREVREGDTLTPGVVWLAKAGRHLTFVRGADGLVRASLPMQPLEKLHRPSADVLFKSAAEVFGERVLAVVMTGMGDDGKEGAAWVKARGGAVITESEKSCVIYGMPRSVVEAGLSDAAISLSDMAQAITDRI
ncbi:chemotaxis-specific protein-glutamate methyltransferase CheB [Oleiharenicola lentus]|uniref:chemotaxis-specific protein-glutamate methyltransferase CheB n=1 Tax=Oleiharenicola lentus TaxID=2508720 RepID=UPI003F672309